MIKFICLASGSSGNSYYIEYDEFGILIDAGISYRIIKKRFKENGLNIENICSVLITHDHADHIRSVGYFGEELNIPIYTTKEIHSGINKNYCISSKLYNSVKHIEKNQNFILGSFVIRAFEVPHDSTDCVGYNITCCGKTIVIATDLGKITDTASVNILQANYLILESNYDTDMLKYGRYSQQLKERVAGEKGHMSNEDTAFFLANNYKETIKHIWLCHLSNDNNTPEKALQTTRIALEEKGIIIGKDVELTVLKRNTPSLLYHL